ncbi:bacterioferritin-associated ferredoxin [Hypericibacter adhaerens]|jgi:bacterioferritin-associated ferredoxin|uniref:Bacterioferritin-associated ferredoxin n=1 Tax=Hypericibacter adhaerens TaxID=2602016 RepID=A0A5J6N4N9_9PROT|nr:(2Fe-2S)-binding protein [Hypericibacter adhaerens]QEX24394.1 bacterioferritin-associated ferredoxin [Hypericibacter adhaerens]
MYVCNCNGLSEGAVREQIARRSSAGGGSGPGSVGQLFGCFGCKAQCGKCVAEMKQLIDEASRPRSMLLAAE